MGELAKLRSSQPAELDLVEACRRGDRDALQRVFIAHSPYLERLLGRILGPSADLEDVMQNTFVAAIAAFPRFRGEAHVRTWLARIAIRTAQARLRAASTRRNVPLTSPDEVPDDASPMLHGEHALDTRRALDRLYVHLDAIGDRKQLAFLLHVVAGQPLEEVAALTGAGLAATKSRVFWARRELLKRVSRDPVLRAFLDGRSSS